MITDVVIPTESSLCWNSFSRNWSVWFMAESCCLTRVCSGQKGQMILFKCIIHLVITLLDFISAPCAAQRPAALHGRAIFSNKVIFIWVYMSFALTVYSTDDLWQVLMQNKQISSVSVRQENPLLVRFLCPEPWLEGWNDPHLLS